MDPIIKQWARTRSIGEILNGTHMSMVTSDRRILGAYERHESKGVLAFIKKNDRMQMIGWGKNSEDKLSRDLGVFILRELLKQHDPKKAFLANYDNEGEAYEKAKEMDYASLEALYKGHHQVWWQAIDDRNRTGIHLLKAANFLQVKWPDKYAMKTIGDYRFPTAHKLLGMDKFGRKKLYVLLQILAWAALSDEDITVVDSASPSEVIEYARLSMEEKAVLEERYIEGRKTLQQIGDAWSRTRERARQIETKAIEKIRKLEMDTPVRKWLLDQSGLIWASLSKDEGESVKSIGDGRKAYRNISGEAELALLICDISLDQVLRRIGEQVGEIWIRRKTQPVG
ncbi:MAG: hypothetical protein NWS49_03205 [Opitutales bacterium]|nr:hypothetical protein [Opitutales bacterium]